MELTQIILLLDVDADVDVASALKHVPDSGGIRHQLRITEFGYERAPSGTPRSALNWPLLLDCVHKVAYKVQQLRPEGGVPADVYVSGLAPLSVFFTLGTLLDSRTTRVTAINKRRTEDVWDVLPLVPVAGPAFFTSASKIDSAEPNEASGRVCLFISLLGPSFSREAIKSAAEQHGDRLAGIVKIATANQATLDLNTIGQCVHELTNALSAVAAAWPSRSGISVFLAGSGPMALAAGFSLNLNQYVGNGATVDLTEYVGQSYIVVGRLPLPLSAEPTIPNDATSELTRRKAYEAVKRGIVALKDRLLLDHIRVPNGFLMRSTDRDALAQSTLRKFQQVRLAEGPVGKDFWLSTLKGEMSFGHGLLQALLGLDERVLQRIGQLFALHELVHDPQNITSNNYQGIGRAGVVLEDLDFWADAFAISVAFEHQVARGGEAAREDCRSLLIDFIDAHIAAIRAFDRMEQGDTLHTLPERRLRRYLIWYLQRARAETIRKPEDAHLLLDTRVFVEIAPLKGRLDERYDKIVTEAQTDTELFITIGGKLIRMPRGQGFVPGALVEAVRTFNEQSLNETMDRAVDAGRSVIAPWVEG